MDKNSKMQQLDNSIDEQLKSAFGYSDEQLLAEFEAAEKELKEHPELLEELKAPADEFEKILDCVKEYGTSETTETVETNAKPKRSFRSRKVWKMLVAAALVGVLVLSSALVVCGKKSYKYWRRENAGSNRVIWNNDSNLVKASKAQDAYQEIQDKMEIDVIALGYLPGEMIFHSFVIGDNYAVINFEKDDKLISLAESGSAYANSSSTYTDTEVYKTIYNNILDIEIPVRKNILEDDSVEYTADFCINEGFYSLSGNISEDKFLKMVEQLIIY